MLHKPEDFVTATDNVSSKAALLEQVDAEVYASFTNYLSALMTPYTSVSGKADYEYYDKMMPIAASLTQASAILAAASTDD